jgi:arabinose-5-phosphate isomerase
MKEIIQIGQQVINKEAEVLRQLAASLDEAFSLCVQQIFASKGRLVVTGIGKSAIVGQKIVATLNSTGTQAIFMHAADAIHGDLGIVTKEDWVLCISKSGETPEIKVLVPLVKQLGKGLIAMVAEPHSYLGQNSDFLLHTPVNQEADPNNLAPTTSTTAQMAMGDALAMACLHLRGFSSRDFAQYHPGGSLGKRLYLRVADVYLHNEKPQVDPEADLRTAIVEISGKRLGATAVVDGQRLLGIITDGDIRRIFEGQEEVFSLRASQIMSANPKVVSPEDLAVQALSMMKANSITQLPVVESGRYLGILHLHDLLREGIL